MAKVFKNKVKAVKDILIGGKPCTACELAKGLTQMRDDLKNGVPLKATQIENGNRTTGTYANGEFMSDDGENAPVGGVKLPDSMRMTKPDDAEVERVAPVVYNELQNAMSTMPIVVWDGYDKNPSHDLSRACRWIARAAISAMRGKRWGVWRKKGSYEGLWIEGLEDNKHFVTTDQDAANCVATLMSEIHKFEYEVREYPAPMTVPLAAVEAAAQEIQKMNAEDVRRSAKAQAGRILTAAWQHLKEGADGND